MTLRSDSEIAKKLPLWRQPIALMALVSLTIGGWALGCQAAPGDRTGVMGDTEDGGRLPPPRFNGEQPEFDDQQPEGGRRFEGGPGGPGPGGEFQGRRRRFMQQQGGPEGMPPQDMGGEQFPGGGQFNGPGGRRGQFGGQGRRGGMRRGQFGAGEQGEFQGGPGGPGGFPGGPGGFPGGPGGFQGGPGGQGGPGMGQMGGGMMMRRNMQRRGGGGREALDLTPLGLNEDQKTKIQAMREQTKTKARELRKAMMSKQMEVKNLMFSPDATDTQIRAARRELRLSQERLDDMNMNDLLAIRAMLTADQKKRLPECMPGRRFTAGRQGEPGQGKSAAFAQRIETRNSK